MTEPEGYQARYDALLDDITRGKTLKEVRGEMLLPALSRGAVIFVQAWFLTFLLRLVIVWLSMLIFGYRYGASSIINLPAF